MNEITRVALENEMDLILAHKQSMRLLELTGATLSAQTSFATAVSEIARVAIGLGQNACLILSVSEKKDKQKKVLATIKDDKISFITLKSDGYRYAKRLAGEIDLVQNDAGQTQVEIHYNVPGAFRIDDELIEKWIILFNTDPSVSPYEEIKRKNRELVELSDKLKHSEGQYRTLTNSLPLMIFTLDKEANVTYGNSWLQEYTGQTVETLNNTNWKEVLHPGDASGLWGPCKDMAEDCEPVHIERRLRNIHTNEYRWYTGIATPILNEEGELQYWTAYLADIHAQKTVEQTLKDNKELKETQARLEDNIDELNRSNRELEQFAYVASHDLQEPLRKINFYSDFLKRKYKDAIAGDGEKFIDNIINATERMRLLIHDILTYSTIDKDKRVFTKFDLNRMAGEAISDLEIAITERDAQIQIDTLPEIVGNENQIKQLFENLISNSIKYTDASRKPQIHIYAETDDTNTTLFFKDNGIGFEEKYLERMFALFQRLHGKDKYVGTGIGLTICKKIVDIHNGEISAESELGKGATFMVKLPLAHSGSGVVEATAHTEVEAIQ